MTNRFGPCPWCDTAAAVTGRAAGPCTPAGDPGRHRPRAPWRRMPRMTLAESKPARDEVGVRGSRKGAGLSGDGTGDRYIAADRATPANAPITTCPAPAPDPRHNRSQHRPRAPAPLGTTRASRPTRRTWTVATWTGRSPSPPPTHTGWTPTEMGPPANDSAVQLPADGSLRVGAVVDVEVVALRMSGYAPDEHASGLGAVPSTGDRARQSITMSPLARGLPRWM